MKAFLALIMLIAPAAALAASDVSLSSVVFVEHNVTGPDGKAKIVREAPKVVVPGDQLVFELNYRNGGAQPAEGFVVTNPIPASVAYAGEAKGAVVSVDGGKSWGALDALKIAQADGTSRPATPADVTHVRWSFAQPIAAGSGGKLSFRGVVK